MQVEKPIFFTEESQLPPETTCRNLLQSAITELFFIEHPQVSKQNFSQEEVMSFVQSRLNEGVWVYYPWKKSAVKIPHEELYTRLRTARNRNLITEAEQEKYRSASVGIAGLSVGSAVLSMLVATGGPRTITLSDPDFLEITNLNRIRATLLEVGDNKTSIAARAAYEIDPYLTLTLLPEGLSEENIDAFVNHPTLDVCVDEMDNIERKFACREVCKEAGIPVVMATDNGDSVILDIERFDLEPERPLFHGRVDIKASEMKQMTREKFVAMANAIIDPELFTKRQQESIMEIGRSLSGVPQLGTAAMLSGVAVSYAIRRIVNGQSMPSGRYTMSCEASFIPEYSSKEAHQERRDHTEKFKNSFR